jgi:hypothetical protein
MRHVEPFLSASRVQGLLAPLMISPSRYLLLTLLMQTQGLGRQPKPLVVQYQWFGDCRKKQAVIDSDAVEIPGFNQLHTVGQEKRGRLSAPLVEVR